MTRTTPLAPAWGAILLAWLAGAALLVPQPARAAESLPAQAYIEGVPFVSFHDVRAAGFPGSDVLNPSFTAVAQMMFHYWGEDFVARSQQKTEPEGWATDVGEGGTLADLKALLARGIPVEVAPAATPHAHHLYLTPKMCGLFKPVPFQRPHRTTGALGQMISLEAVEQLRAGSCGLGLNDSVILATRLLIGYDDARQVFVMHDPSLGPDLELSYAEFERMWQATEARYWATYPQPLPALPAGRVPAVRARTPDDDAAVALFRAYGLETLGDYRAAEGVLREALARDGLSPGRRHLLRLELAVSLNETGRCAEAIEVTRLALADFDDYAAAHNVLAVLLECSGERAAKKEAKRERKRVAALCGAEAQRRVADELGRDFCVMGCKQERLGWYRP